MAIRWLGDFGHAEASSTGVKAATPGDLLRMAVPGVTRALQDGQDILVDGDRGVVRRLA